MFAFFRENDNAVSNYKNICDKLDCTNKHKEMLERYTGMIDTVVNCGRLRDVKDLEEVIRTELLKPQTASLSPENHFENDWKTFKRTVHQTGGKFAYTHHTEGFNILHGFRMRSGLNRYADVVKLRTEMLMESGNYGLWKKWENLRGVFHWAQVDETEFVELSFRNSDAHLIFYLWAFCIGITLIIFIREVTLRYLQLRDSEDWDLLLMHWIKV